MSLAAIYGYSFCKAAQKAFSLLVSNALRVAAINSVGAFVLILTKLSIVAITIAIGYVILRTKQELTYIWVPLLIVFIYSYFIAHCFISVYEMCIDTLFLCFCEDCERNDGINSPYYMSRGLMQFVENSKKALEALEERQKEGRLAQAARKPSAVRPATAIRPTTAVSTTMISAAPAIPSPAHYITPAA
uniref:Choline transporter-like protein n=1 Tax=Scylla olivacea TaxID=85551 RepID=A0A0P4W552_SCYOL